MPEDKKQQLRKSLIQKRNLLSQHQIDVAEESINEQFWEKVSTSPKVLHTYIPINKEASTLGIIKKALSYGWTIVVPQTLKNRQMRHLVLSNLDDLEEECFGTFIPKNKEEYKGAIDIVLVPGVGFSKQYGRMGYGGGYYDTFLPQHPSAKKWGITYKFQIIEDLPLEEHDVLMDTLLIG
ncbi:5-formyltetrahydrofolate cyclo-ligase [Flammeovirga sp. MY04]|uniref:5-formyltetrahydrofolate cyclo-ligase n=1 Tax=Flammeovirga sp. MY04 TaxID=1191459 RepID=UPI00080612BF|nr:5-formyltetrahydrofolate cyclo-ligase [Flammeovirga sp. MY04]ANQ49327.1 5-formyltetrahydrofolate cyclo-ligase [Flammeovirga sp. MY04]